MAYQFNSEPPLPPALVGTPAEAEMLRRRQLAAVQAYVGAKEPVQERPPQIREVASTVRKQAETTQRGEKAGIAMAQADEEREAQRAMLAELQGLAAPKPVAGNMATEVPNAPIKPNTAEAAKPGPDLTPKRATSFYEAVQQMDPLGRAFIAGAMDVSPDVFKSPEEMEIDKRNAAAVLGWRTAMDDPNSVERKALDSGDYETFSKRAIAAGAMDPTSGLNVLRGFMDADKRREDFGYDPKVYDQALIPVLSKSRTLSDAALAAVTEDGQPLVDQSGRVVEYDMLKVMTTPGAVEDVARATGMAAQDDILGTKDMRPYVHAANLQFFDAVGSAISSGLNIDPGTGIARWDTSDRSFLGMFDESDEKAAAVQDNLQAFIDHNRVSLVASRRFSPEAVAAMDDMEILSVAIGKPRLGAILGSNDEVLLGDAKAILQQQTLFAPNGYNTILSKSKPATTATGDGKPSGGDSQPAKKEKK